MATAFLLASYDGQHTADVLIDYSYWEKTCGLCGTFDGDKSNDMLLPNGEEVRVSMCHQKWLICNFKVP